MSVQPGEVLFHPSFELVVRQNVGDRHLVERRSVEKVHIPICAFQKNVTKIRLRMIENFLECYHCPVQHPGFSAVVDVAEESYDPQVASALAEIEVLAAELRGAEAKRDDLSIEAPQAGVVTKLTVHHAGEVIAPRTPIVVVTDLDHAWANVYIDEPVVPRLKIGQKMTLLTDAGQRIDGTITFISPKAEFTPRNVQTAEERSRLVYRIKVTTDNRDGILKTGMPVEAEIPR